MADKKQTEEQKARPKQKLCRNVNTGVVFVATNALLKQPGIQLMNDEEIDEYYASIGIKTAGKTQDLPKEETPKHMETDKGGYVWDRRIHVQSRTLDSNGMWKLKRNLDPQFVAKVLAEQSEDKPLEELTKGQLNVRAMALGVTLEPGMKLEEARELVANALAR